MRAKEATPRQIRIMERIRDHGTPLSSTVEGRVEQSRLAGTVEVLVRNNWVTRTLKKGWQLTDEGRLEIFWQRKLKQERNK